MTYQHKRGPGQAAVYMCGGQRRLGCPDSWWGEAETAGTHNKPDARPSAGADWPLAGEPTRSTSVINIKLTLDFTLIEGNNFVTKSESYCH